MAKIIIDGVYMGDTSDDVKPVRLHIPDLEEVLAAAKKESQERRSAEYETNYHQKKCEQARDRHERHTDARRENQLQQTQNAVIWQRHQSNQIASVVTFLLIAGFIGWLLWIIW